MTLLMAFSFFTTAALYSMVGFAGGSTYLALLTLWKIPYAVIPVLALSCNIIVASANSIRFLEAGLFRARLLLPHALLAVPLAYVGGRMDISKNGFQWLVAIGLLSASLQLLVRHKQYNDATVYTRPSLAIAVPAGGILGFFSGLIGIGGGIFLSPLLYLLKAGTPREIASTCTFFILINSFAGIIGQMQKQANMYEVIAYWPLFLAVLSGGMFGNFATIRFFSYRQLALFTAIALLLIDIRLLWSLIVPQS